MSNSVVIDLVALPDLMEGWNSSDWGFWSKCGSSCRLISGSETLFVSPISMDEYQNMIFTTLIYVTGSSERHNLLLNNILYIKHQSSVTWELVDWTFFLRSEVSSHLLGTQQFDLLHLGPLLSFIKAGSPHTRTQDYEDADEPQGCR